MNRRHVLVADDEPYILRSLTYVLRKEGFEVSEARNGREALEFTRKERPDLVFLDVMMPERNGFEVCREIRSDPELRETKVIMLTARGQDAERGKEVGADEYLTKPFSPTRLVDLVRRYLGPEASTS